MKQRPLLIASFAIICAGTMATDAYASNDCGLREGSLGEEILSQSVTLGEGDAATADCSTVYDVKQKAKQVYKVVKKTNAKGCATIKGSVFDGLLPNSVYTFTFEVQQKSSRKKYVLIALSQGDGAKNITTKDNAAKMKW